MSIIKLRQVTLKIKFKINTNTLNFNVLVIGSYNVHTHNIEPYRYLLSRCTKASLLDVKWKLILSLKWFLELQMMNSYISFATSGSLVAGLIVTIHEFCCYDLYSIYSFIFQGNCCLLSISTNM